MASILQNTVCEGMVPQVVELGGVVQNVKGET